MVAGLSTTTGVGVMSIAFSNIILSIFLGLSLRLLWVLLQNLQLIIYLSLLNVVLPPNVVVVFQSLLDIANLNFIPKALIASWV